jgi:hypothetical protein
VWKSLHSLRYQIVRRESLPGLLGPSVQPSTLRSPPPVYEFDGLDQQIEEEMTI